jgi:hypothetical protein
MSLDVYLNLPAQDPTTKEVIFVRADGKTKSITREEWDRLYPDREPLIVDVPGEWVYSANITHNLNTMADHAGIYMYLWRPEEIGVEKAEDLIVPLEKGLAILKGYPEFFKELNPSNGWGDYEGLVRFTERYLAACREYPEAKVDVSR